MKLVVVYSAILLIATPGFISDLAAPKPRRKVKAKLVHKIRPDQVRVTHHPDDIRAYPTSQIDHAVGKLGGKPPPLPPFPKALGPKGNEEHWSAAPPHGFVLDSETSSLETPVWKLKVDDPVEVVVCEATCPLDAEDATKADEFQPGEFGEYKWAGGSFEDNSREIGIDFVGFVLACGEVDGPVTTLVKGAIAFMLAGVDAQDKRHETESDVTALAEAQAAKDDAKEKSEYMKASIATVTAISAVIAMANLIIVAARPAGACITLLDGGTAEILITAAGIVVALLSAWHQGQVIDKDSAKQALWVLFKLLIKLVAKSLIVAALTTALFPGSFAAIGAALLGAVIIKVASLIFEGLEWMYWNRKFSEWGGDAADLMLCAAGKVGGFAAGLMTTMINGLRPRAGFTWEAVKDWFKWS